MAVWNGTVTTQLGINLIAKVIAGKTNLDFTVIRTSDKVYIGSDLTVLTALEKVKQEIEVSQVSVENNSTVSVKGLITNTNLSNQYSLDTIGLYATDPDLGEILFSVTTADIADVIPAKTNTNTTSLILNVLTSVTDANKVTLSLSQPAIATTDMLEVYIKDTDLATESIAGTIKISTTAQVTAGTDNTTAVSPAKLKEMFVNGLNTAANGYQKLPGGLIIQWGASNFRGTTGQSGELITLPIAFPNAFFRITGTDGGYGANAIGITIISQSQFRCWGRIVASGVFSDTIFHWIAIGY